jgi:hypothetical protein
VGVVVAGEAAVFALGVLVVLPLLAGIMFETCVLFPIRVHPRSTPVLSLKQDWAMGAVLLKFWARMSTMGWFGQTRWKRRFERLVRMDKITAANVHWMLVHMVFPLAHTLLLALCVPYVVAAGIAPLLFQQSPHVRSAVRLYAFPAVPLLCTAWIMLGALRVRMRELHDHLRDAEYIVGRRLNNRPETAMGKLEAAMGKLELERLRIKEALRRLAALGGGDDAEEEWKEGLEARMELRRIRMEKKGGGAEAAVPPPGGCLEAEVEEKEGNTEGKA